MYGGMLPNTGGLLTNPLRVLYLVIALHVFAGAWVVRKLSGKDDDGRKGEGAE
jgi:hypothetical protein